MNYPLQLSDRTVAVLYARAEHLERRWRNVRLGDDFSGRMIDAVLRHLRRLEDRDQAVALDSQTAVAIRLLDAFWTRNAKRDYSRLVASRRPVLVPLEDVSTGQSHGSISIDEAIAEQLVERGEPEMIAWAFVMRRSGMTWKEVAESVAEKAGEPCSPAQARQWATRHFGRLETKVTTMRSILCA